MTTRRPHALHLTASQLLHPAVLKPQHLVLQMLLLQVHSGPLRQHIEARCDQNTAIENRHLQLEEDQLVFEIKPHEQEMKLKEMELEQRYI